MLKDPTLAPFFHGRGYEAPATFGLNPDASILEIGTDESETDWEWEPLEKPPSQIVLRVRLQEIPLSTSLAFFNPTVQCLQGEYVLKALSLYGPQISPPPLHALSQHQEIQLIYTGEGFYVQDGESFNCSASQESGLPLPLIAGDKVYTKPFRTETSPHVTETLPPVPPQRILRPFGGFWDGTVETAEQIYYEISEDYPQQTRITLFPSSSLPQEAFLLLPEPTAEERIPLTQAIRQGFVQFTLQDTAATRFHSFEYAPKAPNILDITFVPAP